MHLQENGRIRSFGCADTTHQAREIPVAEAWSEAVARRCFHPPTRRQPQREAGTRQSHRRTEAMLPRAGTTAPKSGSIFGTNSTVETSPQGIIGFHWSPCRSSKLTTRCRLSGEPRCSRHDAAPGSRRISDARSVISVERPPVGDERRIAVPSETAERQPAPTELHLDDWTKPCSSVAPLGESLCHRHRSPHRSAPGPRLRRAAPAPAGFCSNSAPGPSEGSQRLKAAVANGGRGSLHQGHCFAVK